MITLLAIIIVGIGTYSCRAIFILAFANRKIPNYIQSALQYVAPATLSALVVSVLVDNNGQLDVGIAELTGLTLGAVVAYFSRSHLLTLFVGMSSFLLLLFWL